MLFTSFVSRDNFREPVFLWITPFLTPLSITDCAEPSKFEATSFDFSSEASRICLTRFFILVFEDWFLMRRLMFCLARFIADLWLANFIIPFYFSLKKIKNTETIMKCQIIFKGGPRHLHQKVLLNIWEKARYPSIDIQPLRGAAEYPKGAGWISLRWMPKT